MGNPCPHPAIYDRGECCGKCPIPPQDSVSDVERLRERIANIIRDNVSGPDIARGMADAASHRADQLTAADLIIAALSVPINKIGKDRLEQAAVWHDAQAEAAETWTEQLSAAGRLAATQEARSEARFHRSSATAIRRLSTSTDKGVSNGR